MLFVWTSEGGPLQYVALGLFLLQVLPQVFPDINQQTVLSVGLGVGFVSFVAGLLWWQLRDAGLRQGWRQWMEQARRNEWSYYAFPALIGVAAGVFLTLGSTTDLLRWLPYLGQFVTVLSLLGFGRGPPQQQQQQQQPNASAKLEEMAALVRRMPLEPFMPEEDMATAASIAQLKQMLRRRGTTEEELNSFVERQNLVEALQTRRQYSETCCICFENLAPEEPMRILPNCGHELHVECLDKWVYTFATNAAKLQQEPTCPLCKEGMIMKE